MLFKRYASPFLLIDETIKTGRFSEYVTEFINILNDETEEKTDESMWEYYLHRVFDKSFVEFLKEMKKQPKESEKSVDFEATIKESYEILNDFVPDDNFY